MISTLLIANRGEIACRIARTVRAMGIRIVAVYSEADRDALHVRMADEAVAIGPAPAIDSYLVADAILDAARKTGADAIHPGYGFLSENAGFAEACEKAGIVFVGPPSSAIRDMGLKDGAKALMEKSGVPVVPGYHGAKQDAAFLKQKAYETGYPVLLKAVAGGGGKGMRRVDKAKDFEASLAAVQREAESAFGDPNVLVEKFVLNPRHIEIQVFADSHGNAVHLFERDCSAQRRHQKVIEEAPAPGMTDAVREAMGQAAVNAAKAVGYVGAGTVEFIADGSDGLKPDGFWFMEMNTRLQVEHPVTEMITGMDLVEWQLRVAAGEALPVDQSALGINGHAVEARIYAEDPAAGFLPSVGRLDLFRVKAGDNVRVDTGVEEGAEITPYYDPMIAKVIAHGTDRAAAFDSLSNALREARIAGPKTNVGFLSALVDHPEVRAGAFDTGLIDRAFGGFEDAKADPGALAAAVRALVLPAAQTAGSEPEWQDPWAATDGFQLAGTREIGRTLLIDGEAREVRLAWQGDDIFVDGHAANEGDDVLLVGRTAYLFANGAAIPVAEPDLLARTAENEGGEGAVKAPMTGKVVALAVEPGAIVEAGTFLFAVEAMKMEHAVASRMAGTVTAVNAEVGVQVEAGAVIVEVEEMAQE